MARMIPERRDDEFPSPGERLFYAACRKQLPDHIVVLHSCRYLIRDPRRWDEDGEIDFLIIDPQRGFLLVEVKDGQIKIQQQRWYRSGTFFAIMSARVPFTKLGRMDQNPNIFQFPAQPTCGTLLTSVSIA